MTFVPAEKVREARLLFNLTQNRAAMLMHQAGFKCCLRTWQRYESEKGKGMPYSMYVLFAKLLAKELPYKPEFAISS